MKLSELFESPMTPNKRAVFRYTNKFRTSPRLVEAIQQLMADPNNVYTGPLFRTVFVPHQVALESSVAQLEVYVHAHSQQVSGWSKTLSAMSLVIHQKMDSLSEEGEYGAGIVLTCNQPGLDVNKLAPKRRSGFRAEEEVLVVGKVPVDIYGYDTHPNGITKSHPRFVKQLKEYLIQIAQDAQDELEFEQELQRRHAAFVSKQ